MDLFMKGKHGEALALWLNTGRDQRVQQLFADDIRRMNRVIPECQEAFAAWVKDGRRPGSMAARRFSRAFRPSYSPKMLKGARAGFGFTEVRMDYDAGTFVASPCWVLDWHYPRDYPRGRLAPGQFNDFLPSNALTGVVILAQQGTLNRLRECLRCGNWLYARFRDQKVCSTKCQQAYYWSSSEWKAHRRVWMRDYRQKIALPNVLTRGERKSMKAERNIAQTREIKKGE
jgi:hypothetical protein